MPIHIVVIWSSAEDENLTYNASKQEVVIDVHEVLHSRLLKHGEAVKLCAHFARTA